MRGPVKALVFSILVIAVLIAVLWSGSDRAVRAVEVRAEER